MKRFTIVVELDEKTADRLEMERLKAVRIVKFLFLVVFNDDVGP